MKRRRLAISIITIIILFHQLVSNAYEHRHTSHIYNDYMITVISIFSSNLFLFVPGTEATSPQAHEDRADELAEGGRIDRIQFLFLTVP